MNAALLDPLIHVFKMAPIIGLLIVLSSVVVPYMRLRLDEYKSEQVYRRRSARN